MALDTIDRRNVEARFVSMLRSIYHRSSIDHEGLRNPVELWIAKGGRVSDSLHTELALDALDDYLCLIRK